MRPRRTWVTFSPSLVRSVSQGGRRCGLSVRRLADAGEDDLVVAHDGGDERLALGRVLVGDLADRSLLRVDRRTTPRSRSSMSRSLSVWLLEHRPEAHLEERDPAVGGARGDEVPGRLREAAVTAAPSRPGIGISPVQRAVRAAEEDDAARPASPRRGTSGTRRRRPRAAPRHARRRRPRPGRACPASLPSRPGRAASPPPKMKTKMKRTLRMMKTPPKVMTPVAARSRSLTRRDPLGRGRHPLANAEAGGGHVSGSGDVRRGGASGPATARACYSSFFSSSRRSRRGAGGSRP